MSLTIPLNPRGHLQIAFYRQLTVQIPKIGDKENQQTNKTSQFRSLDWGTFGIFALKK